MSEDNPFPAPEHTNEASVPVINEGKQRVPSGLGGWLILLGIEIVTTPIRIGASIFLIFVPLVTNGTWARLTTPISPYYDPFLGPLLVFEAIGNLGFTAAYIVLTILFFRKSRIFPKTFIAISFIYLSFVVLDAWFTYFALPKLLLEDAESAGDLARASASLSVMIWVPYMLVSKRVKNTFV